VRDGRGRKQKCKRSPACRSRTPLTPIPKLSLLLTQDVAQFASLDGPNSAAIFLMKQHPTVGILLVGFCASAPARATHTHTRIRTHTHTHRHTHTHTYTHTHIHTYTHTHLTHTHANTHTCTNIHTQYTNTHKYAHTHTRTHTGCSLRAKFGAHSFSFGYSSTPARHAL